MGLKSKKKNIKKERPAQKGGKRQRTRPKTRE